MSVRLRHPNIVRIYELGSMSNRYYLSMEYIEGGTLLALIHGGKDRNTKTRFNSDPLKFLNIMKSIAFAVDYAHNSKPPIIHRDLKPHNVLVDMRHNPYVVDFGLAKEVDAGEGTTLTGVVKGTPTYMAPEQAEGRKPRRRSADRRLQPRRDPVRDADRPPAVPRRERAGDPAQDRDGAARAAQRRHHQERDRGGRELDRQQQDQDEAPADPQAARDDLPQGDREGEGRPLPVGQGVRRGHRALPQGRGHHSRRSRTSTVGSSARSASIRS
jgi:hypothetical protein